VYARNYDLCPDGPVIRYKDPPFTTVRTSFSKFQATMSVKQQVIDPAISGVTDSVLDVVTYPVSKYGVRMMEGEAV